LENDDATITPNQFKMSIGKVNSMWNEFNQQDSQEFFNFLISQIEEENGIKYNFIPNGEITFENNKNLANIFENIVASKSWLQYHIKEYSPLKEIFNGLTKISRKCLYCNTTKNVFEPFVTLPIAIPVNRLESNELMKDFTIYDCMDKFVSNEQLDNDNQYTCELCGLKNKGHIKSELWQLPKILVIHIKRFINMGLSIQKLTNNVIYPFKDLDLSKYIGVNSPHIKSKYDLFGINIHQSMGHNRSINSGHYISFVKNIINYEWNIYNDSCPIQHIINKDKLQNRDAYMLFYYRQE
jgi:ubiquitin C-terminal hydrolase